MPANLSTLGKVFAVRGIRPSPSPPPIPTPPSINITPPQEPGFPSPTCIHNTDPSSIDSRGDQMREYGILALTMTAPLAGSIPVIGSPLKAVVGVLLEVLKAADGVHQNKKDIQRLREKLVDLQYHISTIPYANDPVIRELRDRLTNQLKETSTRLESLQAMPRLRYSSVKQTIKQCAEDIEYYLHRFSALTVMYMAIFMEQQHIIRSASISRRSTLTGVVLMDAIGKRHEISMAFTKSYKMFTDAISLLFNSDTLEAQLQLRYMQEGMYDLAIDGRDKVIAINEQQDWSEVQAGTTIVMRVILLQKQSTDVSKYQCPRCRKWNYGSESSSSIDCRGCDGRFQISNASLEQVPRGSGNPTHDQEVLLLRNFHLKKYAVSISESQVVHISDSQVSHTSNNNLIDVHFVLTVGT